MKSFYNNLKWVVSCSVAVAMLAVVSCSGNAVSPLGDNTEASYSVDSQGNMFGSVGPMTVDSPVLPKSSSGPGPEIDDDMIEVDPHDLLDDLLFNMMHIALESGENEVDHKGYMYHSENAYINFDEVRLASEETAMSFVTYGFRNIPAGEEIRRVEVTGNGEFSEGSGLWIGIGDPEKDTFKWTGPYSNEDDWVLNMYFMDNTNDLHRAYLTLAVSGGDAAYIHGLDIYVGGLPVLEHEPIFEMGEYMIPLPDPFPDGFLDDLLPEPPGGFDEY
jgi:hypothetical protein